MNIIDDSSLDCLDEMTNTGLEESNGFGTAYVQPKIRDVGDVGIGTGINFSRLYESQWNPLAFVGFRSMRIYKIKNYISGYLILTALFFAVSNCHAQSFMEKGQKHLPFSEEDATRFVHPSLNTATPIMLQEQGLKIISENEFMSLGGIESYNKQDSTKHLSLINSYNLFGDGIFGIKNLGIHVISSGNTYVNLLKNKSAAIILNYQNDNFCIKTGVIANQYATRGITTQLGINGFLEYKISRHWSLAVYGTIYDFNPYFSMATFPFIETTSYGGWIKYEGEKMGVKLGARRYYDAFQKQWKMEPIITPSIKIGKKMYFELPVGPLVQRSMEKLLKRQTNNSPVITPNLK